MSLRTTHNRTCAHAGCGGVFDDFHQQPWPRAFCSPACWKASKPAKEPKRTASLARVAAPKKRKAISPASTGQRLSVQGRACIVCRQHAGECDPAHLISRAALTEGQDDPRAVVPLCRDCHTAYDQGGLSILEYLEPHEREILAYAVQRYGLLRTLQRVTGQHWAPVERDRSEAA